MGVSKDLAAGPDVAEELLSGKLLERDGPLQVPHLADVERASVEMGPTEEEVRRALEGHLGADDALSGLPSQVARQRRQVRAARRLEALFDLEKERVGLPVPEEEDHVRPRPHAPEADDVFRNVDRAIPVEQVASAPGQGPGVRFERREDLAANLT